MPFKKKFMQNYSDGTPPVFPGIPSDPSGPIRPTSTCCLLQLYYPTSNWDIEPDGEKQRQKGRESHGWGRPPWAGYPAEPQYGHFLFPVKLCPANTSAWISVSLFSTEICNIVYSKSAIFCHFTFFVFYILVCICVGTALSVYADQKSSWVQREQRSNTKLARDRERTVTSLAHITGCE